LTFRRRSQIESGPAGECMVLLLDTIGELSVVYSLAWVALIGGSFLPFGGHNPLEPAVFGKPVIFGPEMSNFKEIASLFIQARAARQCPIEDLPQVLIDLLRDPHSGRSGSTSSRNNPKQPGSDRKHPCSDSPASWLNLMRWLSTVLAPFLFPPWLIMESVVRTRNKLYAHGVLTSRSLPAPVISIGNLTVAALERPLWQFTPRRCCGNSVLVPRC